uniref:hAT-like transposase RNase-H fold domain-containing protein n=1 Tax=Chenopodium quinoa TaxID=63459 RepID=A0A803NB46_CHEQI
MASKNDNNASVPTSASNTPITLDDDEKPVEINSDPYVLPITSRHTSAVWSDFKRKRSGDAVKVECNHCSKLLAGFYVSAPHSAEVLADALKERIQSWNLDLRLSSITVDNCLTNDAMMEISKGVFPNSSLLLRGTNYPTANLYFPKICALRIAISGWLLSPHDYVRKMADIKLQKYNKYWANVNGLMGVVTILYPRYKMAFIRFYFAKTFDEHDFEIKVGRIRDLLQRLVEEYGSKIGET